MNDGNTTLTTEVPTEEDMNKVRSIFERGINAIVDASNLKSEVEVLRQTINEIKADLDKLRQQNAWLDEQLLRVRSERDEALRKANESFEAAYKSQNEVDSLHRELEAVRGNFTQQEGIISRLTQERDDAIIQALALEETVTSLRAKLERFLALADEFDPPQEPELMQPTPMVIPPVIIQEPTDNYEPSWRNRA